MLLVRPSQQQGVHELGCCDVRRQERRSLVPEKTPVVRVSLAVRELGFKITAVPDSAAAHGTAGLVFTSPQDCWQLKQGETTTIEFLATFRCFHTCGLGHRGMKGRIVVD
jgi:hypothetical protein